MNCSATRWLTRAGSRVGLFTLFFLLMLPAYAQNEIETAKQYLLANTGTQPLSQSDINGLITSSAYLSPTTGWYHIYFNQSYQSIGVYNRLMNVVMKNGQVTYLTHNFLPDLASFTSSSLTKSLLTPTEAALKAALHVGFKAAVPAQFQELTASRLTSGVIAKSTLLAPAVTDGKIDVELYWLPAEDITETQKTTQKLLLTWNVRFLTKDGINGWNIHVDATSGAVVRKVDDVIHCNFGTPGHTTAPHSCQGEFPKIDWLQLGTKNLVATSYTVFDYPLESPSFGARTTVINPHNRFATGSGPGGTNGWHDDGVTSYTTTRGNNVWSQEDANNNNGTGASPTSATLDFNYPYTFGLNTATGNQNAAITNLFYWNNVIHDVLWKFGFDEPSGNFQASNQGRGGLGNDYVFADAQDGGGTNNANFYTPGDGSNGRMQMYLWNYPSAYQPDGDFDNGIIAHEYGHGWSTRLTGGPANSSCLNNAEQGGEGWSDYLSLMLTTNWSSLSANVASANIPRGIGTYALGQSTSGSGIRPYRYSYDMVNVNGPVTYAKVGDVSFSQPHGIGSIWATMLWDMTWEVILQDNQIVANIYDTPANVVDMKGNVAALKLVNEGLRLQVCNPSFVQARDAILQADQLLFGGRYRCAIARAFARRGLGANASTGTSSDDRIVSEQFTPVTGPYLNSDMTATVCSNSPFAYTATSATAGVVFSWTRPSVAGISNAVASGNSSVITETLINTTSEPITVTYFISLGPDACGGTPVPQRVRVVVNPLVNMLVGTYSVCQNGPVPTGEGLVVAPSLSTQTSGTLVSGATYARASGNNATIYSAGSAVYYKTFSFVAPSTGSVTFAITAASLSDGFNDTYLSIYQNAFNPVSPGTNFLRGDDDSGVDYLSSLTQSLVQGTTYVVVVATYATGVTGPFTLQASLPVFPLGTSWFTTAAGGTSLASSTLFNPVGVAGSGIPDTATPGTTSFYVANASYPSCRREATFTIITTSPPVASGTTITAGSSVSLAATGCTTPGAQLIWYQTVGNLQVTMPVTLTATTQYYARCQRPSGSNVCLSDQSANVTVTVLAPTSFDSAASGNWNNPATWTCHCIPDGLLPVRILNTHTVTMPSAYVGKAKGLLLIGTGKLAVQGSGQVQMMN